MHITKIVERIRFPTWLIIAAMILVILAYSAAVGLLIGSGRTSIGLLAAVLPLVVAVMAFAANYFRLLVLALPLAALTLPIAELPTGTESKLPLSLLIALLLSVLWIFSMISRGTRLHPSPLNRPMIVFGVVCIISLPWGIMWRDPILIESSKFIVTQIGSLITILLSMGAAFIIGNFFIKEGDHKYMLIAFMVVGVLMALTELFKINQRIFNDRGLWGMWTVAPAFGILIAQPKVRWYWQLALVGVIVLTLYQTMVINADWISGWFPSVVALLAVAFFRSRKLFFILLAVGALGAFASRAFFETVAQSNVDDGSLERLAIWAQNWRVTSEHWLLGTGPAGYALYYMTYFRDDARSTHNNYLDIVSQFGFIGMGTWLWLVGTSMWEGWKMVKRAPLGWLRTTAIIAIGGWSGAMVAMFFGDWVLPFAYNQGIAGYKYTVYSWLFLGTLISIRHLIETAEATPKAGGIVDERVAPLTSSTELIVASGRQQFPFGP